MVRTDAEIAELTAALDTARKAATEIEMRLGQAWSRRHAAAARVRASVLATRPVPATMPAEVPPPRAKEASTRLVQNALFLLGGLLLGIAAIVFTAVAWAQFGVGGRAALLASFTVAALGVPPLALRRGLTATAETFAAVGLLLTLLDGYAAWYVDLFGVADGSVTGYAGAVCALTAAVAAGYEHLTGLTGPRYAALLVAQPVLPLLAATAHPGKTAWALIFAAVAALNLAVFGSRRTGIGITAAVCAGLATATAACYAVAAGPGTGLLILAVVALAAALLGTLIHRGTHLPTALLALIAVPVPALLGQAVIAAARTLATAAQPPFHTTLNAAVQSLGWQLPIAGVLIGSALFIATPARRRTETALAAGALLALILPAGLNLLWWSAPILDLLVVAAALALAIRVSAAPATPAVGLSLGGRVAVAVLLGLHAVQAGFGRAPVAAGVFAVVAILGLATSVLGRRAALGGAGLVAGLLALPAAGWTTAVALSASGVVQARVVLAVTVSTALAGHLATRHRPAALAATAFAALLLPLWALLSGDEITIYAAAGLLAVAAAAGPRGFWPGIAAVATVALSAATGADRLVFAAAELLIGLACLLVSALRSRLAQLLVPVAGVVLGWAGMIGMRETRVATLVGLGAVLVAAVVAGIAGRGPVARVAGWLVGVAAAVDFAGTAGSLAGFDSRGTSFSLLGVAAAVAALAWLVLSGRPGESRPVEAAAHAVAALALLIATDSTSLAAVVCTFWGLVLGLRALRPAGRRGYLVAAAATELAAWFLLLVTAHVALLEAYTAPAAAVALLGGMLARRSRRGISSWTAFGPALAAGLLPSLASIAGSDGQYARRLLLGLASLAVVLAGANARLRAPVLIGGGVLVLVGLHELAQAWDLIPRWIPLALGGMVLLVLATTVERRRHDLDRFRAAIHRMS